MEAPKIGIHQNSSNEKVVENNELHFESVEITPEQPFKFPLRLKKQPIEINDGDSLGSNDIGVKFEGDLIRLMEEATELKNIPENERIVAVLDLVRSKLNYPFPEVIEAAKRNNPKLGKWLDCNFVKNSGIGMDINECLGYGYGDCKIVAATYLAVGKAAGLKGVMCGGVVKNFERPDTKNLIFKSSEYKRDQEVSHAWVEIQLDDGSWVPVDVSTNMIASNPEMLEFFKRANYRTQFGRSIQNLPAELEGNLVDAFFEPGQEEGDFVGLIKIKTKQINASSFQRKPVIDEFKGDLRFSFKKDPGWENEKILDFSLVK